MGSVVNPVVNRVGVNQYWHNIWCVSNPTLNTYGCIIDQQVNNVIFYYIKKQITFFKRLLFPINSLYMFYCLRLLRCSNNLILILSFPINKQFKYFNKTLLKKNLYKKSLYIQDSYKYSSPINVLKYFYPIVSETIIIKNLIYKFFYIQRIFLWNRRTNLKKEVNKMHKKVSEKILIYYLVFYQLKIRLFSLLKKFIFNNHLLLLFEFFSYIEKSASLLVRAFIWLLHKRQKLTTIFSKFLFLLTKYIQKGILRGYKILFSGRSERRGRSNYVWQTRGFLGLSTFNAKLDYNQQLVILTNSICSIKAWVVSTIYTSRFFFYYKLLFQRNNKTKNVGTLLLS